MIGLMNDANTTGRPEHEHSLADDPLARNGPPVAAIVAVVTVVAHDEVLVRSKGHGTAGRISCVAPFLHGFGYVRFVLRNIVDVQPQHALFISLNLDLVTRESYKAFNQDIFRLVLRIGLLLGTEDDDVEALGVADSIGQLVDKQMVMAAIRIRDTRWRYAALMTAQGGLHGLRRNVERLHEERAYQQEHKDARDDERLRELCNCASSIRPNGHERHPNDRKRGSNYDDGGRTEVGQILSDAYFVRLHAIRSVISHRATTGPYDPTREPRLPDA